MSSILIAGGYGLVGSQIARLVRAVSPDVTILLGGRRPEQGQALAKALGNARTTFLDVSHGTTGVDLDSIDLIVAALADPGDRLLEAALTRGAAHIEISKLTEDVAPTVFGTLATPPRRPIVLASHWQAGVHTLAACHAARAFTQVDTVELVAAYDAKDPLGDMAAAEVEHIVGRALLRAQGRWQWVDAAAHARQVTLAHGATAQGLPLSVLDVPSLAAATGAANVRFDFVQHDSLGTQAGRAVSHDLYIDLEGRLTSGARGRRRTLVSDPQGQAHMTALGVLLSIERILGLDGRAPASGGLYSPETLVDPADAVARLRHFGLQITDADTTDAGTSDTGATDRGTGTDTHTLAPPPAPAAS